MTTKYQQEGGVITYANSGSAIAAGDVVVMGHTIGIALTDIAATTGSGAVAVEGVFSGVPKVTAAVFTQGEKLIWDVSAGKFDDSAATPATGDVTGAAIAWVAGANNETTCTIKLTPGNATVTLWACALGNANSTQWRCRPLPAWISARKAMPWSRC